MIALGDQLSACRRCDLWRDATQAVAGEGPASAALMLVAEQPGDAEDLAGRPFFGPAGQFLDRALADAGIERVETDLAEHIIQLAGDPPSHIVWPALHKTRRSELG